MVAIINGLLKRKVQVTLGNNCLHVMKRKVIKEGGNHIPYSWFDISNQIIANQTQSEYN